MTSDLACRILACRILAAEEAAGKLALRTLEATGPTVTLSRDELQELAENLQTMAWYARHWHAASVLRASAPPSGGAIA